MIARLPVLYLFVRWARNETSLGGEGLEYLERHGNGITVRDSCFDMRYVLLHVECLDDPPFECILVRCLGRLLHPGLLRIGAKGLGADTVCTHGQNDVIERTARVGIQRILFATDVIIDERLAQVGFLLFVLTQDILVYRHECKGGTSPE